MKYKADYIFGTEHLKKSDKISLEKTFILLIKENVIPVTIKVTEPLANIVFKASDWENLSKVRIPAELLLDLKLVCESNVLRANTKTFVV